MIYDDARLVRWSWLSKRVGRGEVGVRADRQTNGYGTGCGTTTAPVLGCQAICNHFALCTYATTIGAGWDGLVIGGLEGSHEMRPSPSFVISNRPKAGTPELADRDF